MSLIDKFTKLDKENITKIPGCENVQVEFIDKDGKTRISNEYATNTDTENPLVRIALC